MAFEDPAKVAKIIDNFSEDHESFEIKRALLDGLVLNRAEVKVLAKLPPAEVLKSQFLGLLSAPLTKFLATVKEAQQAFCPSVTRKKQAGVIFLK